jgi:hypothetical protein
MKKEKGKKKINKEYSRVQEDSKETKYIGIKT